MMDEEEASQGGKSGASHEPLSFMNKPFICATIICLTLIKFEVLHELSQTVLLLNCTSERFQSLFCTHVIANLMRKHLAALILTTYDTTSCIHDDFKILFVR